jgi:hypothetical protein
MLRTGQTILRLCFLAAGVTGVVAPDCLAAARPAVARPSAGLYARAGVSPARLLDKDGKALPEGVVRYQAGPPGTTAGRDDASRDLSFQTIAQIYPVAAAGTAFGDTDHDLNNEIFMYVNDTYSYHYRILENQGDNTYTDEYSGDELIPYGVGDFDRDGLADLVGQRSDRIVVYEALDANSYPTRLAWTSPPLMNVECFLRVADTDQDGRDEFLYSYNPFSGMSKFYIFENTGNDTYTQVYVTPMGYNDNTGEKVVADLDNDGRTEIAMCGLLGVVYVIECLGNNTWNRVWTSATTGLFNAYGCEGGDDTNNDGWREFFVSGSSDPHWCWETQVFEATGNNLFQMAASLQTSDGYLGLGLNAYGELDGVPPAEFISEGNSHFWIWRPNVTGGWDLSQTVPDPLGAGHIQLVCSDVNGNGRAEVFWLGEDEIHSSNRSLVLEADLPASLAGETPATIPVRLRVAPNPCRAGSALRLSDGVGVSARLSMFDGAGRLMGTPEVDPSGSFRCPVDVPAGVYWLRLGESNRRQGAWGKIVVRD